MTTTDITPPAEVKDGVDRETVEAVQSLGSYKYGWKPRSRPITRRWGWMRISCG